ncbi:hypothetical protein B0O99DRAFT_600912 [Bisporella sp. PMI_857]|nr:hypothetical protein B0O99DRAFT_600912 [Bisporella sp. PMI_857]
MQDSVVQLEEKLDKIDEQMRFKSSDNQNLNRTFRSGEKSEERFRLIWKLQRRIQKYNDHISSYQNLGESTQVTMEDLKMVKDWLVEYKGAVEDPEQKYLDNGDDLVYILQKTDRPWLQNIFCSYLVNKLGLFRRQPTDSSAYDPERLLLQDKQGADRFLALIILPFGLFMLIGPLWILHAVHGVERRLGVITGFIVLFAALVFSATKAKIFECLATTVG